jgi:hypothetical protein
MVTIKGKVAFPIDTSKMHRLNVPQKDTAANMRSKRDDKSIIIEMAKLSND